MSGTQILDAIDKIGDTVTHANKKFDKRFDEFTERLELLESGKDRPKGQPTDGVVPGPELTKLDHEHKATFLDWIRKPSNERTKMQLTDCQHELSKKDATIGSNSAGGFGLPKEIADQIEVRVRQLSPFRGLVDVQRASTQDYNQLVSLGDGTSGWVGETGTRTATLTPTLRNRKPTIGELYAYPQASNWSLDDLAFDVQQWLVDDVSADWSAQEATAIISGNGTNKPTGILNTTPVATADYASPMRSAEAIQFLPLVGPTSPTSINFDSLINLVGNVAERYLQESDRCAFVMHRLTAAALRQKKATTAGSYLWSDALIAGQPQQLLGYPVFTCDAMPTNSNDNFAVLFGNWRRSYLLVDRTGFNITLDQVTNPGYTRFYLRRRVGGILKNNDSLKALRISD